MKRKIVVAFDHAGFDLKKTVINTVEEMGCEVIDVGTSSNASVDFPDYALLGAEKILKGEAERGIFVCGSGIGMSMACNKIKGMYAAVCHDSYSARQGVEHDDMNGLCLGSRVVGPELAADLIRAYLGAVFNCKPNQKRRMDKVRCIEAGEYFLSNNSERLNDNGQSIWYDNIQRKLIKSGEMQGMIAERKIRGVTSNPSIFQKAISGSDDYDNALIPLALANKPAIDIYTQLSVEDIRVVADLFRALYIETNGKDGYVSLEVCPTLAYDCKSTVEEAKKLWKAVNRPNLMIKVPATAECLPAITELVAAGININVTLIFSNQRYAEVADAYMTGLETRLSHGSDIDKVHSVASIFVSRIDSKVDPLLEKAAKTGNSEAAELVGKTAIRNSQLIYNTFLSAFSSERFAAIKAKGGNLQRPLWASTSSKNPSYKDTIYIESLIGEDTVNTVPPATLEALLRNLSVSKTLPAQADNIQIFFDKLSDAGINFDEVTTMLEKEGVQAFDKAFVSMLNDIDTRSETIRADLNGLYQSVLDNYKYIEENSILPRIFTKDPTVWTFDTQAFAEIRNRLGWLDAHTNSKKSLPEYQAIRDGLKRDGIRKILLLGMGGSSLAPEVMANVFSTETDIKLTIVDSTDPDQVLTANETHDPEETVYIVSSKSGGTAEVRAFLDFFFDQTTKKLGDKACEHFIAITDPGTALERTATEMKFRNVILSDPSVGGRFSALTPFGVVPAVLMGLNAQNIFTKASEMAELCAPSIPAARNEGLALGVYMGAAALQSKDKLTILTDKAFKSIGSWLEQLIAESSGKLGKGIIPVDIEPKLSPEKYAMDRAFVYLRFCGEHDDLVKNLVNIGQPVYIINLHDSYDLFSEFYRWEIAIAVACSILKVNAFDQPNVQDSKTRTVAKVNEYHEKGKLIQPAYNWNKDGMKAYYEFSSKEMDAANNAAELIDTFISSAKAGTDYIAINAYLPRNEATLAKLQTLREHIINKTGCATTLGFGPRFQHSTGQLHKGGTNNGMFIQLVADYSQDAEIPNEDMKFSVLERAQALGDFDSLLANSRRAVRIDLQKKSISDLS